MVPRRRDRQRATLGGVLLALVGALTLAGCVALSDPGYIIYSLGEEGDRDLAVVRPDGTEGRVVIADPADDFDPIWSPDGTRIAFLSTRAGNVEVYVAPSDGSSFMRVTNTDVDEASVAWSPDGRILTFVSPDQTGRPHVFWVRIEDLIPNRLDFASIHEVSPVWSPDGKWVAYSTLNEEGRSIGLFLRNPRGVNRIQLTQAPDSAPAWAPDSERLAFVSTRDGNEEIYVVRISEEGAIGQALRATNNPARDFAPAWAPDGKRIAFLSDRSINLDIYTVSPEGEDERPLTRNDVDERSFAWGPDGRLAFVSELTGKPDLFVMTRDGEQQNLVSSGGRPASQPNWVR